MDEQIKIYMSEINSLKEQLHQKKVDIVVLQEDVANEKALRRHWVNKSMRQDIELKEISEYNKELRAKLSKLNKV